LTRKSISKKNPEKRPEMKGEFHLSKSTKAFYPARKTEKMSGNIAN